jgi:hypothetical protein
MERFHIIDDSAVIVRVGNIYKQVRAYRRGTSVYANVRGGYVRLLRGSGTSVPGISWDGIEADGVRYDGPAQEPKYVGAAQ